ncbi:hypothetical protein ACQPUY_17315 [Clostridium nigeriense]|uniref:hypothetical protein n=1 Tax=Clostridium nigeriense TaxID=1805470 RepID=UPI003D330152
MPKYRKKPVVIEAIQWTGNNLKQVLEFSNDLYISDDNFTLKVETLEGVMTANKGDYIIKGVTGEFYPCKPDIFEQTYELADKEVVETAKAVVDAINKMQRQTLASSSILNI